MASPKARTTAEKTPSTTEQAVWDGLYDPWRQAYTPRLFEVVRSMTYADGPAIVLAINHRRQEALLRPLEDWGIDGRRTWQPFSMIRKRYDQAGRRPRKSGGDAARNEVGAGVNRVSKESIPRD